MLYLQSSLGIECRQNEIILTLLGKGLKKVELLNSFCKNLAQELPNSEQNPDSEVSNYPEYNAIQEYLSNNKIHPDNAVVGIPRRLCSVRIIEIPAVGLQDLRETLEYEIDRHIPFKAEEAIFDYRVVGTGREGFLKVMVTAAKKQTLHPYLEMIKSLNLPVNALEVNSYAVTYGMRKLGLWEAKETPLFLVGIYQYEAEVQLVLNDSLEFYRGVILPQELLPHPSYEKDYFDSETSNREDTLSLTRLLVDQMQQTLDAANRVSKVEIPSELFLYGSRAKQPYLEENLAAESGCQIKPCNLLDFLEHSAEVEENALALPTAIGLSLEGFRENLPTVNLLPASLRHEKRGATFITTAILAALVFLLGIGTIVSNVIKKRVELKHIEVRLAEISSEVEKLNQIRTESLDIEKKLKVFWQIQKEHFSTLEILRELTQLIPQEAWINELTIKNNQVILKGDSKTSTEGLIETLDGSQLFEKVSFQGAVKAKGKEREEFTIQAFIEKLKED